MKQTCNGDTRSEWHKTAQTSARVPTDPENSAPTDLLRCHMDWKRGTRGGLVPCQLWICSWREKLKIRTVGHGLEFLENIRTHLPSAGKV